MAKILENCNGRRRMIKMSVDDIISIVREYQRIVKNTRSYEKARTLLGKNEMYLPEDI